MAALPRNAAIPAALRPRTTVHHVAIVVPDVRVHKFLVNRSFIVGPSDRSCEVHAHVFTQTPDKPDIDTFLRWALVDTGLLVPEQVGLVPVQVDLGWDNHEAR